MHASAPSPLTSHTGFWMRFVSNQVSGRFKSLLERSGVSLSEWVALRQLHDEASGTSAALMQATGMTKGAVSKVLDRLERKGWAVRLPDPRDSRAQKLQLTREGRALVPQLARLADDNDTHFFGHLSATARRQLHSALQRLVHHHHLTQLPTE